MLVLSRKPSEAVIINQEIVIEVLSVRGTQVKLGINAPREVTVLRAELHKDKSLR